MMPQNHLKIRTSQCNMPPVSCNPLPIFEGKNGEGLD